MTNPVMNTYLQVGKVEDISDEIGMISPTNTPFLSAIGSEGVHNTVFSWLEDKLDAPALNAQVEGAAAPAANQAPTTLRTSYTQIFAKSVATTGTADAVQLYGKPGVEYARQMAKKGKEIKRDLEFSLTGNAQTSVAGNATTARKLDSAQAQIDSSVTVDMEVLLSVGAPAALTEGAILAAHQACYQLGGEPSTLLIKVADSIVVAGFAHTNRTNFVDNQEKTVSNVINVYVTPFGELRIVKSRWMNSVDALLIDPTMWKIRPLRNWRSKVLAETGDSRSTEILGEFGLSHKNFQASARITNLA